MAHRNARLTPVVCCSVGASRTGLERHGGGRPPASAARRRASGWPAAARGRRRARRSLAASAARGRACASSATLRRICACASGMRGGPHWIAGDWHRALDRLPRPGPHGLAA